MSNRTLVGGTFTMITLGAVLLATLAPNTAAPQLSTEPNPGCLQIVSDAGKMGGLCPLKGTDVQADVAGFGARVTVRQTFVNPSKTPIEAVYTFPLPSDAAVDQMRFKIGSRIIEGVIKRREEARRIYEAAKNAGQAAALLDQERPNIFTQSVANIMPGDEVEVEISYVQLLKYEEGWFEFTFPMVVGPRFTGNAPDPNKIFPPITPKGTRTGANIHLKVDIDAGTKIEEVKSELHDIDTDRRGDNRMIVTLVKKDEIPNRDFILRYRPVGDGVKSALLTTADSKRGGFFTLILLPPKAPDADQIAPKEIIFVMDQSGSQSGFPIEKSRELTLKLIQTLNPDDTFNVMGFANTVNPLWSAPRPVSPKNVAEAERFVSGLQANGGTQLRLAVEAAFARQPDPKRLRVILFNTDGFVGDDFAILDTIQKVRDRARIFTFGIGNGVNRFLIDAMAAEGRGDVEYVTLAADADAAVARYQKRLNNPILTDIAVKFEGVQVTDVLPGAIPDVFSEKPVIIKGRYTQPGRGKIIITGKLGGEPWWEQHGINLPATDRSGSAIATLWAREKIDEIMRSDWMVQQRALMAPNGNGNGNGKHPESDVERQIVDIALRYGLMTQYTSFVAVEQKVINVGGKQITVQVPVEMADGVSYEGIFGEAEMAGKQMRGRGVYSTNAPAGGGFGGGGTTGGLTAGQGLTPATTAHRPLRKMRIGDKDESLGYVIYDPKAFAELIEKGSEGDIAQVGGILTREKEAELLKGLTATQKSKYLYIARIDKKLRDVKSGNVAVQIWVREVSDELLRKFKEAGVTISLSDKGLKAVFGECDVKELKTLAEIQSVVKVLPLEN